MNKVKTLSNSLVTKATSFALSCQAYMLLRPAVRCDAFDEAASAATNLQTSLVKLADTLFPLSLVVLFISIIFTRDQKALKAEIATAVTICIVFFLIHLVGGDHGIVSTLTGLLGE